MGTAAASAEAAGPAQDLPRDYGPDGAAGGLKPEYTTASGRHDSATFGSGPTRPSDDRDSGPDYLLCPTMHGPGTIYNSGKGSFYLTINA